MSNFSVMGIVGLQGSGKTEVAKVAMGLGIPCVRMGDVVWGEVRRRGLEINETTVGAVADELRRREGLGAIAKRCIPIIERVGRGKRAVVVDGVRGIAEVEEFRRAFGDRFRLLAVWASEKARYSRIVGRGRADDIESLKAFREKDRRELGWGLGEALALAEAIIVNEGTLEELREKAAEVIKSMLEG
ncbi:MAG: AAA family ATPase [Hadesarchaea archaeon]|nr:AAA family ATPase [Hadesarchaea archaeon]